MHKTVGCLGAGPGVLGWEPMSILKELIIVPPCMPGHATGVRLIRSAGVRLINSAEVYMGYLKYGSHFGKPTFLSLGPNYRKHCGPGTICHNI